MANDKQGILKVGCSKRLINQLRPYFHKEPIFLLTVPVTASNFLRMKKELNEGISPQELMQVSHDVKCAMDELAYRN